MPFLTSFAEVQVTVQTDSVSSIPCGTSGGVLIHFDRVEVVNRLASEFVHDTIKNYTVNYDKTWIFDKIHHEINQFCSKHSLQQVYIDLFDTLDEDLAKIIAVRVTKPRIPESIRLNYQAMENEKTKLLVAHERQKIVEKEADTDKKKYIIEAQKKKEVSRINMEMEIQEKESVKAIYAIEDAMHVDRQKALADAEYYKAVKEATGNKAKLTKEFLEYTRILSLSNNTKIYFGEKIPSFFFGDKKD